MKNLNLLLDVLKLSNVSDKGVDNGKKFRNEIVYMLDEVGVGSGKFDVFCLEILKNKVKRFEMKEDNIENILNSIKEGFKGSFNMYDRKRVKNIKNYYGYGICYNLYSKLLNGEELSDFENKLVIMSNELYRGYVEREEEDVFSNCDLKFKINKI
jgi:hypothetical protein